MNLPPDLVDALDSACAGIPQRRLAASVDRLISRYRDPHPATAPILASPADVAAYAAYRMPATWAAMSAALRHFHDRAPGFAPATLLDIGGGTGAALWAAAEVFPSLTDATVLDQVDEALRLGRALGAHAASATVRAATWQPGRIADLADHGTHDLATICYVLSELTDTDRADLIATAAAKAAVVAVVEPGTPSGYRGILAARDVLLRSGMTVVAPCPHQDACPLAEVADWCHFSARIARTALHRRLKGAELGHEDEKFSYVVAARVAHEPAPGRILRHPLKRKGLVTMQVCTADEGVRQTLVSKRQGAAYRAARDAEWGDPWPPPAADSV